MSFMHVNYTTAPPRGWLTIAWGFIFSTVRKPGLKTKMQKKTDQERKFYVWLISFHFSVVVKKEKQQKWKGVGKKKKIKLECLIFAFSIYHLPYLGG